MGERHDGRHRRRSCDCGSIGSRRAWSGPPTSPSCPMDACFVAEEAGQVRVLMPDGQLLAEPALSLRRGRSDETRLLALAADARFAQTISCMRSPRRRLGAGRLFTLTRFREASNALVDAVVLRDDIPASPSPAASLRSSADGTLVAAFDDGGDVAELPGISRLQTARSCASTLTERHQAIRPASIRCMPRTFTRHAASTGGRGQLFCGLPTGAQKARRP